MKWISVEEKLPEEGRGYLVAFINKYLEKQVEPALFIDGTFVDTFDGTREYHKVTHWSKWPKHPWEYGE